MIILLMTDHMFCVVRDTINYWINEALTDEEV